MKGERLTKYQIELMVAVQGGAPDGSGVIDFDQLLEQLSWAPTKESCHFSLRALIRRNLLQKTEKLLRRGRLRVGFQLTSEGNLALDPREEDDARKRNMKEGPDLSLPGFDAEELPVFEAFDGPLELSFP